MNSLTKILILLAIARMIINIIITIMMILMAIFNQVSHIKLMKGVGVILWTDSKQ